MVGFPIIDGVPEGSENICVWKFLRVWFFFFYVLFRFLIHQTEMLRDDVVFLVFEKEERVVPVRECGVYHV